VVDKVDLRAFSIKPTKLGAQVTLKALQALVRAHESFFKPLEKDIESFSGNLQELINANN
jgi:hypothetical protein